MQMTATPTARPAGSARRPVLRGTMPHAVVAAAAPETEAAAEAAAQDDTALPAMPAERLERLALLASSRLRGRLRAAEARLAGAAVQAAPDRRQAAAAATRELEWLLTRIDLHVAIARESRGAMVSLDPALHAVLSAVGRPGGARGEIPGEAPGRGRAA